MGYLAIRAGAEAGFHKASRILADLAGGHADHTFGKRRGTRRSRPLAGPGAVGIASPGFAGSRSKPQRQPDQPGH
jgi:hypothetical protein